MLKLLKDLKEEWKGEYESSFTTTVEIAMNIAFFAHRGAQRVNGEAYITHPKGLADHFSYLSQINEDDFDEENLYKVGLHYQGVLEVCWMHDVIEDTPYTIEEIEEVFEERGLGDYFRTFIKRPLELITHDKSEPYPIYIEKVCKNLTASIIKFLDLCNNSNPLTLDHLGDKELKRIQDYASYMKMINDEWHLIERFNDYLDIVYMKRWQKRREQKGDLTNMACSGVWIEHLENGGIAVGVTDYHVLEFGDSDWEWSAHFDKDNAEKLINSLKKEFDKDLTLQEIISIKFGHNLDTIEFAKYCDNLKLNYEIKREC